VEIPATSSNIPGTLVLRDASGNLSAGIITGNVSGDVTGNVTGDLTGDVTGNVTGNSSTATALQTSRTVELSGDVTGSASFDGSANASITASIGSNKVVTAMIADANVTTAKILDANVTPAKLSQPLTLATAQNTTSGTSIDFTGIPSWAQRITVMLNGVSTSGTSALRIQLRVGNAAVTTNYATASFVITNAVASVPSNITNGWGFAVANALSVQQGQIILNRISDSAWIGTGQFYDNLSTERIAVVAGRAFSVGTVDGVRLTTTTGTDTFDAGTANIMYEG